MTDTNQLPEPELGYIQTDKSNQPAFSARQMREVMEHALQARAQVQGEPIGYLSEPISWGKRQSEAVVKITRKPQAEHGFTNPIYTTPQPAQATQAEVTDDALIRELVDHIERNTCTHEETHRGGAIWEVCDSCGARWADDEGGKPEFKWPAVVEKARAILALRPERVQMTGEQWTDVLGSAGPDLLDLAKQWSDNKVHVYQVVNEAEKIVKAAVLRGITAQAKKEDE